MSQSRAGSAVEAVANVAIGFGVAVGSQIVIFPMFGINIPLSDDLLIGAWFTGISLLRSFALRRVFNRLHRG
jgi:hypothetical protein